MAGLLETMPQEPWHPEKGAKSIMLSNSTAQTYTPMQVIKQPEHVRTSTTEGNKNDPFRQTLINS